MADEPRLFGHLARDPKKALPWSEMTGSQRFVATMFGLGGGMLFLVLCFALSVQLLRWAGVL